MSPREPTSTTIAGPPGRALARRRAWVRVWTLAAAAVVFVALAWGLRRLERSAGQPLPAGATPGESVAPITLDRAVAVRVALRALKVVTVEIRTEVTSRSFERSVMGDVEAAVTAPVRLLYGCDLSGLPDDAVEWSETLGLIRLTVPPPSRVSGEVLGQFERAEVRAGWLRSREGAGERHLGLARRDLHLRAQRLVLDADQARQVRDLTRDQLSSLVSTIAPGKRAVIVFGDE
ncbi:MAG: hypothetical protein HRU70_12550 [Phycisphaeraceae bacterium]|nr:MAG: hypothetical protein HRU70_12550 [Phycisphaeraceae bacterium]